MSGRKSGEFAKYGVEESKAKLKGQALADVCVCVHMLPCEHMYMYVEV